MDSVIKYATEKGFTVVLDVSSPQSPVLFAANEVNITNDIIQAYDAADASTSGAAGGEAAAKPPVQ
jgi:outer membrane protein